MNNISNDDNDFFTWQVVINKLQLFVIVIAGVINLMWVMFQMIEYFFISSLWENSKVIGTIFIILACAIAIIVARFNRFKSYSFLNHPTKKDELNVYKKIIDRSIYNIDDSVLLSLIKNEGAQENWENVLQIGMVSSTMFWRMSRYDLRIRNGEYVKEAIEKLKNNPEYLSNKRCTKKLNKKLATILIDDLGYTYVEKGEYVNAETNIKNGLSKAIEIGDKVLICKSYRHLSGIYLQLARKEDNQMKTNINEARKYYINAKGTANKILSPKSKIEMYAFLNYLIGSIEIVDKEFNKAIKHFNISRRMFEFIHDYSRGVKVYYQYGQVYERTGHKLETVVKMYKLGYNRAKLLLRNDQTLKNGCALCRIFSQEGEKEEFFKYYKEVYELSKELKELEIQKELEKYVADITMKE